MCGNTTTSDLSPQPGEQEPVASIPVEHPPSSDGGNTPPSSPQLEAMKQSSLEEYIEAAKKSAAIKHQPRSANSPSIVGPIVSCLEKVHEQMSYLEDYIANQDSSCKPLYQWQKYGSYSNLSTAVWELEEATTKFKTTPPYSRDYVAIVIARATRCSTSVSRAAVYVLSAINKKTGDYMEEMEGSSLSDDAKMEAYAVITQETRKLLEHSTRAAEHVWRATDLLRMCKQQREQKDWLWSTTATAMHVFIAATVGIFAVFLFSPATSVSSDSVTSRVLDVVWQTQAITNLTGEIYNARLQNIDQRANDLSALSEANALRIDNLVDGLGVPNENGVWYVAQPSSNDKSCGYGTHLQEVSDSLGRQLQRQQQELKGLRSKMHRMDIRLTQDLKKLEKKKSVQVDDRLT